MAHAIWPERVERVCREDRSIALAHGLEELFEGPRKAEGRTGRARTVGPGAEAAPSLPSLGGKSTSPARRRGAAGQSGRRVTGFVAYAAGEALRLREAADSAPVLSEAAEQILAALRAATGPLGRAALVELAGIREASWLSAISQLKDRGVVQQVGERRGAVYLEVGRQAKGKS